MQAKQFVTNVLNDVWCHRDKQAVEKYYHPDFIGVLNNHEQFFFTDVLKRVDYNENRYQNNQFELLDIFIAEDDHVVARIATTSFDKESNELAKFNLISILGIKDGKMYRQWTTSDQHYRYKAWE